MSPYLQAIYDQLPRPLPCLPHHACPGRTIKPVCCVALGGQGVNAKQRPSVRSPGFHFRSRTQVLLMVSRPNFRPASIYHKPQLRLLLPFGFLSVTKLQPGEPKILPVINDFYLLYSNFQLTLLSTYPINKIQESITIENMSQLQH